MLCTGFAQRFGEGKQARIGLQVASKSVGGGCLPIDFLKLSGRRETEVQVEMMMEEVEVQKDFESLFNGDETTSAEQQPNWNVNAPFAPRNWNTGIYPHGSLSSSHWPLEWEAAEPFSKDFEEYMVDEPAQKNDHQSIALARLEQLNLHLLPLLGEVPVLRCGHAKCSDLLARQRKFVPHAQIRGCVHSGCGYVSSTAKDWMRHVSDSCSSHEDRKNSWTDDFKGEQARCCGL